MLWLLIADLCYSNGLYKAIFFRTLLFENSSTSVLSCTAHLFPFLSFANTGDEFLAEETPAGVISRVLFITDKEEREA